MFSSAFLLINQNRYPVSISRYHWLIFMHKFDIIDWLRKFARLFVHELFIIYCWRWHANSLVLQRTGKWTMNSLGKRGCQANACYVVNCWASPARKAGVGKYWNAPRSVCVLRSALLYCWELSFRPHMFTCLWWFGIFVFLIYPKSFWLQGMLSGRGGVIWGGLHVHWGTPPLRKWSNLRWPVVFIDCAI